MKKSNETKRRILWLAVACLLLTAGCGQRPVQQDANAVRVALVCRDGMQYDVSRFQKGMEMAVGEYTGDLDITVAVYDQSTNFEEALEIDTRLAQDPDITAVVTLQDYDEIDVAAQVMDKHDKAYFAVEGFHDKTARKGYDSFFPYCLSAEHLGYAMGVYVGENGLKRPVVIHSGTPFETTQANYFERALLDYESARTVNSLSEPATVQELYAIMDAMGTLGADAVYTPYYRSAWATDILMATRERQPDIQLLGCFTLGSRETVEALNNIEGMVQPAFYPVDRTEEYSAWAERYEALYGEWPENQTAQGYDIMNLVIANYDGDNTRVAKNIRANASNAAGVAGNIAYDLINGLPEIPEETKDHYNYEFLVIQNGKFVSIQ